MGGGAGGGHRPDDADALGGHISPLVRRGPFWKRARPGSPVCPLVLTPIHVVSSLSSYRLILICPEERLVIYCQTTGVSAAHATHCATFCTPCRPLIRAFSGWIRTPPSRMRASRLTGLSASQRGGNNFKGLRTFVLKNTLANAIIWP